MSVIFSNPQNWQFSSTDWIRETVPEGFPEPFLADQIPSRTATLRQTNSFALPFIPVNVPPPNRPPISQSINQHLYSSLLFNRCLKDSAVRRCRAASKPNFWWRTINAFSSQTYRTCLGAVEKSWFFRWALILYGFCSARKGYETPCGRISQNMLKVDC